MPFSAFEFRGKVNDKENLCRHIKKAKKEGIRSLTLHGLTGTNNGRAFTDFHMALTIMYASEKSILSHRVITDMVNVHILKEEGLKTIVESTISHFLCRKEVKSMIEKYRFGKKSFENRVLPFLPRDREKYAGDLWAMDGTPLQFWCKDEAGKRRRLNFYIIVDAFSSKIMGYDISISEDRFNVINAIEMAFTFNNHLPSEILHDNFSANKTDEIKTIKSKLAHLGVTFRASKVGNSKDKTHVERAFGRIQTLVMKLFHDYIGEGITTRRKEDKPDDSFWKEATKKGDLTMDEMKHRLSHIVKIYNRASLKTGYSPDLFL